MSVLVDPTKRPSRMLDLQCAAGSAIVLNGFGKPEDIAETQAKIVSDFGVKAHYSPADMSKAASIVEMIAMTLDNFGRLDVLANNAGSPSRRWDGGGFSRRATSPASCGEWLGC